MKKKRNVILLTLLTMLLLLCSTTCFAATKPIKCKFTLDRTLTNATTKFSVLYEPVTSNIVTKPTNTKLYVTVNGKTVFRKKCSPFYNDQVFVNIKKLKENDVVRISLKGDYRSNCKTIIVKNIKDIVPSKRSSKVFTPLVKLRQNSNGDYVYRISAKKGEKVIIRNAEKVIKEIDFTMNCTVTETCIVPNLEKSELYIYAMKDGYRSKSYKLLPRSLSIPE